MEWLFGGPAGWQEGVAAVIVAAAVVSLYRHLRGLFGAARPGNGAAAAGCHGCAGDCEEPDPATNAAPAIGPGSATPAPGSTPVTPTARGSLH